MTVHVVSHTHWDREWYRPMESFRARLAELVARVCDQLDAGELRRFHLDGQTVTALDALAVRPDLADWIRAHAAAGRLHVGPWHVLADNQLVSGENLVRNLLAARRVAADLGLTLADVGYCPDAFGHPADLPRVLRGFGLDTALVWRGAPPHLARFRWRAPDGSEVLAVNQGYYEPEVLWDATGSPRSATGRPAGTPTGRTCCSTAATIWHRGRCPRVWPTARRWRARWPGTSPRSATRCRRTGWSPVSCATRATG
ncbi:hypothetical protein [Micromonospora sediminicola]|uniref:glycoside hydrolase family 38 N-terminal domain-containing protein n=1 Tax=Micromonospora sediminicola TaxID=946078 RepID=UPI0033CDFC63